MPSSAKLDMLADHSHYAMCTYMRPHYVSGVAAGAYKIEASGRHDRFSIFEHRMLVANIMYDQMRCNVVLACIASLELNHLVFLG